MITTLLKHEFIRTRGMLATITGIAALTVAVGTAMTATSWPVIAEFGTVLAFLIIAVLVPANQLGLAFDFWNSSFRRTGYFTQTLPVKGGTIYTAKAVWGGVVTLAVIVLDLLLIALFWLAFGPAMGLGRNFFAVAAEAMEALPAGIIAGALAFFVVSFLGWLAQLYFAATLGSGARLGRLGFGGPVIVYLIMYVAGQILTMLGMVLIPLGLAVGINGGGTGLTTFSFIELASGGSPSQDVIPLGFVPPLLVIFVVSVWWSIRNWNRRIALA